MTPDAVIEREIPRQPAVPFLGVVEVHRVRPFPTQGLGKALSLAVGAWRVGPGTDVLDTKGTAGLGKAA